MKQPKGLAILIFSLFLSSTSFAQIWWDFGVRGGVNSGFMINSNILDHAEYPHQWTFGNFLSGRVGTNFGDHSILSVEFGQTNTAQEWYFGGEGNKFYRNIQWSTRDWVVLYRHVGDLGSYFEVGPKFSNVRSAYQSHSGTSPPGAISQEDVTPFFSESYTSAVFGFGSYLAGTENLSFILSFRFEYGIQDLFDGKGNGAGYPVEFDPTAQGAVSHPLLLQVGLEINYDIGYLVSPRCADRYKFVTF